MGKMRSWGAVKGKVVLWPQTRRGLVASDQLPHQDHGDLQGVSEEMRDVS